MLHSTVMVRILNSQFELGHSVVVLFFVCLFFSCRIQLAGLKEEVVVGGDKGMICRNLLEEVVEEEEVE